MLTVNPNLLHLINSHRNKKKGVVLEGSSRSGKTWACVDFLIDYCSRNTGKVINIVRITYNSFKHTLYDDFNHRFPDFNLPPPCTLQDVASFKLYGNKINFIGADKVSTKIGAGCDVFWINEAIHVPRSMFDQLEMRCREFFILDYNPEVSEHWIYDAVKPRDNVACLKTTFRDNPHCPPEQRKKILSYEPTDYNREQGTADPYMWDVYGLGIKAEKKGRIYPDLYEYSTLPEGARFLGYSGDWGFNHPTVVVALYAYGNNLYVREVIHAPDMDYNDIYRKMIADGCKDRTDDCVFDSEDPRGIQALKRMGLRIWRAYKKQGWVMHTIKTMRGLKIHIHTGSASVRKDFENYCWKWDDLTDKPLDVPMETGKDSCDAVGYGVIRFISRIEAE